MAKLQKIKRANGTSSYSVNIPLTSIEELNWKKGDVIEIMVSECKLILNKE